MDNTSLLPSPLQPSLLRRCPLCRKLFALRRLRVETDDKVGEVSVYRCQKCGQESKFVTCLPPHTL
jgi:hypothetical protein